MNLHNNFWSNKQPITDDKTLEVEEQLEYEIIGYGSGETPIQP